MDLAKLPFVSIVVIGLNEESNLEACMLSILNSNYPQDKIEMIYVDSGSIDNSVEIARKYSKKVFIEDIWPSPARNRNRGLIESNFDIVHFIDADIIIDKDYLKIAVEKLLEGEVHSVFGLLEEKSAKGIGKIILHDYSNRKQGFVDAPGAGGTFIKRSLIEVNGWDERIPRGEESELGERLRSAGYKIWFLDNKMGVHDHALRNFTMFLKRQIGEGLSFGAISKIPSGESFFVSANRLSRNNFIFHAMGLLIILIALYLKSAWFIILIFLLYSIYLFLKYRVIRNIKNSDSLKFYFLMNYTKTFVLYGFINFQIKYLFSSESKKKLFQERIIISKSDLPDCTSAAKIIE